MALQQSLILANIVLSIYVIVVKGENVSDIGLCYNSSDIEGSGICAIDPTTEDNTDELLNVTEFENFSSIRFGNTTVDLFSTTDIHINTTGATLITSTPTTTTTEVPVEELPFTATDICICDLHINFFKLEACDINCCCDADCSSMDRQAFSNCEKIFKYELNLEYCFTENIIYHNNSQYKIIRNADSLFCIVKDNVVKQNEYSRKLVTSAKEFKTMYSKYQNAVWPKKNGSKPVNNNKSYRDKEIIWTLKNISIVPFYLPTSFASSFCLTKKPILYLQNQVEECYLFVSECQQKDALNPEIYFQPFLVVANPNYLNQTNFQNCGNDTCLQIFPYVCGKYSTFSQDNCLPFNQIHQLAFDQQNDYYINAVSEVNYVIYHNGTRGITQVEVFFLLINISCSSYEIKQRFSVTFLWSNSIQKPFERSGNPGYIVGKPIIAGQKIYKVLDSSPDVEQEAIELSDDPSNWLSLPRSLHNGLCDISSHQTRQPVKFGENVLSSCKLQINKKNFSSSSDCSALQKHVLNILSGSNADNVSDTSHFNKYVATFGNSKVEETGDWVKVILDNPPSATSIFSQKNTLLVCQNIVKSLHIIILFAHIGSVVNPQAKIIGVMFRFGDPQDLEFSCSPLECSMINHHSTKFLMIQTSVSFYDVSEPPKSYFAELPVYEVKLPFDFFYPFLNSFSNKMTYHKTSILLSISITGIVSFFM